LCRYGEGLEGHYYGSSGKRRNGLGGGGDLGADPAA
jgi:hypothetical protein